MLFCEGHSYCMPTSIQLHGWPPLTCSVGLARTFWSSCVQFGAQEPGSPAEIAKFVADKGVKFNMMVRVLHAVQQDGSKVQPAVTVCLP